MSASTVTCPECGAVLKVAPSVPAGQGIECPRCRSVFRLPEVEVQPVAWFPPSGERPVLENHPEPVPPSPSPASMGVRPLLKPLSLALAGAVLLVGAAIAVTIYTTKGETSDPPKDLSTHLAVRLPDNGEPVGGKGKDDPDQDKKRPLFVTRMERGKFLMEEKRYEEAVKSFGDALDLYPDDSEAAERLKDAREARDNLARGKGEEDKQRQAGDDKRRKEFDHFMDQGKEASADKQYAAAVRSFENALVLIPDEPAARTALEEARKTLEADQGEKKKLADYQDRIAAGRAALAAQRYADAVREFIAAQNLVPDDVAAVKGQHDAEKGLADRDKQDKAKADFAKLMQQAGAAFQNQRYDEALQAYKDALALVPQDPNALKGLKDAQKGVKDNGAEFVRLMNAGDAAMLAQRYTDAVQAYGDASRLLPGDDRARKALRNAEKMSDDLKTLQDAYTRLMLQGAAALRLLRYLDAVQAYGQALQLVPGDLTAIQGLREAQAGLNDLAGRQARYNRHMADGQADLNAKQYNEAEREFLAALAEAPGDPNAANQLRLVRTLRKP